MGTKQSFSSLSIALAKTAKEGVKSNQKKSFAQELDHELVKRAQEGEDKAFNLLVARYQKRLRASMFQLVKDEHTLQDVVQEAFIKAYRALPTFRGSSAFFTWLYRIAVNCAKSYLGSRKNWLLDSQISDEDDSISFIERGSDDATPESFLVNKEIIDALGKALDRLPEQMRLIITYKEMDGLSYEEIAKKMGCPIGTVRSRLFRAGEAIAGELRSLLDTTKNRRW